MKISLKYPSKKAQEPYTAEIVLLTKARMNINWANIGATYAEMIIDVPDEKCDEVLEQYRTRGVEAIKLPTPIILEEERCTYCGACLSICPMDVFSFDENWRLNLSREKDCIQCDACIKACPFDALKLM